MVIKQSCNTVYALLYILITNTIEIYISHSHATPTLPTPTSQLTEKEGGRVEVGNGGFPTTCNVESNLDEEDWELGLIWLQSRQGVE